MLRDLLSFLPILAILPFLAACTTSRPPLPTPESVDLDRFMGAWFVQGYTPILVDGEAHNAVEHYYREKDDRIATTYQFRKGGFDGELKTYTPTGFVGDDRSNARWRMQFIWPFKAKYVILYLSGNYEHTIIAHPNRKYAWIMSRHPEIDAATYRNLVDRLAAAGFDPAILERVSHDWSREPERLRLIEKIGAARPLAEAAESL